MSQLAGVQQAVVTLQQRQQNDQQLVAYIVLQSEHSLTSEQIRLALKEQLPAYMLPNRIVQLDALPLTPSGKIDRRALPEPGLLPQKSTTDPAEEQPRNELEATLLTIWQQVLGTRQIGIHDNFFELGGHSLLAPQVMLKLRTILQRPLALRILFEAPTIAQLAQAIANDQQQVSGLPASEQQTTLWNEVFLDESISPEYPVQLPTAEPQSILLTGANGFVGIYLLRELLRQTSATIYCLIRASSQDAGRQKLQQAIDTYQLQDCYLDKRVVIVTGDLAQPLLGLAQVQFKELSMHIDTIYHCGAWVNFTYPYHMLRATNVGGTQEILRFACLSRLKRVHFISTLGVLSSPAYSFTQRIREDDPLQHCEGLSNGYAESKWVAEQIIRLAQGRGIPVSVYRAGLISGDSQAGLNATSQLIWAFIKGCIQLGYAPELPARINLAPIDYVSAAIVALARQQQDAGSAFHMQNPHTFSWKSLLKWLRTAGYELKSIPYEQWRSLVLEQMERRTDQALNPFLPLFTKKLSPRQAASLIGERSFDFSRTSAGLRHSPIICPPIDEKVMNVYIKAFRDSGFLPEPVVLPQADRIHTSNHLQRIWQALGKRSGR
ncbi:thioester reductase domain-containing protein [Dictyobacter kobayashii]|uniref:thioester reductase domain-containing protein n=1 Tax=Dictyobacter kobayashii TaxID=2014872 RepID=UPI0010A95B58